MYVLIFNFHKLKLIKDIQLVVKYKIRKIKNI